MSGRRRISSRARRLMAAMAALFDPGASGRVEIRPTSLPLHSAFACPVVDCTTCGPAPDPLDQGPVGLVYWWLLDVFPDVWQQRSAHVRLRAARRIAQIRERGSSAQSVAR